MTTNRIVYLSKKGMKEVKKTIIQLEHDLQKALASLRELDKVDGRDERLERVERLAYIETLESELADKRYLLEHAQLLPRKRDRLKVAIGSVVELIDKSGQLVRYTLVDTVEANPSDGRISVKSPLGMNLVGKQIQDVVEWTNGLMTNRWQLVGIR